MTVIDHPEWKPLPTATALDTLTSKQREVLDLLVQFKTSKEISRILEISPHTVDQRVDAAKAKLGAATRAELALLYRELIGDAPPPPYERLTYEESCVADLAEPPQSLAQAESAAPTSEYPPDPIDAALPVGSERDYRVVPELFDGRWGTLARLMAILGITLLLCVAFLGGLSIMVEVSTLMRR